MNANDETVNLQGLEGPRPARPDELPAVLEAVEYVFRVSRGQPPSMGREYPHVYEPEQAANIIIVKDGAKVVCSTGIWCNQVRLGKARLRVGGINAVTTLPEYRRRGLAGLVMKQCETRMRLLGCQVGLLGTGITHWYRKLGWEEAGIDRQFHFNRGNRHLLPALPSDIAVQMLTAAQASQSQHRALLRLQALDRLGGVRSLPLQQVLFEAKGPMQLILAQRKNRVLAYLLARNHRIIEWAGPAPLLAGLLRWYSEKRDDPTLSTSQRNPDGSSLVQDRITLASPGSGHNLIDWLMPRGFPHSCGYCGMLLLIQPAKILSAFGLPDVRVTPVDEQHWKLVVGRKQEIFDRPRLTKLLFGPERISSLGARLFPLPFWQWGIEHV